MTFSTFTQEHWMVLGGVAVMAIVVYLLLFRKKKAGGANNYGTVPEAVLHNPGYSTSYLQHLHDKISTNRYAVDFQNRLPLAKLQAVDSDSGVLLNPNSTDWPLAGACQPVAEPHQRGLNQAAIVDAENSMQLYPFYSGNAADDVFPTRYTAFTVAPNEMNERWMSAQM